MWTEHRKRFNPTYLGGVQLDSGLDDVDGSKGAVCDGAADTTSCSTFQIVHGIIFVPVGGGGKENGTWSVHGGRWSSGVSQVKNVTSKKRREARNASVDRCGGTKQVDPSCSNAPTSQ